MSGVDWYKCRFLESSDNLRPLVKERFGREPSASVARDIAACLQQGRLFYEAAASSPLEIKPLQLYYGMVGFSKALVLAHNLCSVSSLRPAHGLKDISTGNSRIVDLRLRIDSAGTFQEFNDVVAGLTRVILFDDWTKGPNNIFIRTATSAQLHDLELSLKDILSRIPRLESLYQMTFSEPALTEVISLDGSKIRIDDRRLFGDRKSLEQIVCSWRARFPFLKRWRLDSAERGWGDSIIRFINMDNSDIDEFSPTHLGEQGGNFHAIFQHGDDHKIFPVSDRLDPLAGGYAGVHYAISPVNGLFLSEYSFHFMALFLLSSLVRYRPQTWTRAISRSTIQGEPPDDRALSIIEYFLELTRNEIPAVVVAILNPHEDLYGGEPQLTSGV